MDINEPKPGPEANQPDPAQQPAPIDPMKLQMLMQQIRDNQNLAMGILGGAVAALVGAAIWAAVTVATGWQIGFLAIGVGFLVGWAVKKVGQGVDKAFGIAGAVLALIGCLLGNYLSACGFLAAEYGADFFEVATSFTFEEAVDLLVATFSPMDILFYGLALYYGYKNSFRDLTSDELKSVVRR